MNHGVVALDRLVEMGVFEKGAPRPDAPVQYFAKLRNNVRPSSRDWSVIAGLIHKAASWTGTRGLSVMCGRVADEIMYVYDAKEDR